jgi:hypothetical protein
MASYSYLDTANKLLPRFVILKDSEGMRWIELRWNNHKVTEAFAYKPFEKVNEMQVARMFVTLAQKVASDPGWSLEKAKRELEK